MFKELRGVLLVFLLLCCTQIVLANATITINSPTADITYINATQLLNITSDGETTWYNFNEANTTYSEGSEGINVTFNEGANTLYVWANDTDNNITEANITFTIDTIAPSITINSPTNITYDTSSIIFNVTLNENGTCFYTLDSGETNISMDTTDNQTFNYTNSSINDGNYTAIFTCNDTIGNINITNITFKVDTVNPEIIFNNDTTNITLSNINNIIINVTANDTNLNYTKIEIFNSTDLINTTNGTYINYTILVDGIYHFNATTYDLAGRINYTETRNITIDTTAPTIIINTPTASTKNNLTQLLNITANDARLNTTWYNYNGTNITYDTETEINFTEGSKTIHVWANDTAGNVNYTNITFNIIINVAPTVILNSPGNNSNKNVNQNILNITITDSNSDNMTVYIYGDDVLINTTYNQTNGTIIYNWTSLSEGIHNWTAIVDDGIINSTNEYYYFIIDTIAPSINFNNNTDNMSITNRSSIIINITATDTNLTNTTIYIYNSTGDIINITINNTYIEYNISIDGTYFFNATAYDWLGNVNYTETRNITVDTIKPTITINTPTNITYNQSNVWINITRNDTNIDTTWYNYNGTDINYTTETEINLTEGVYTLNTWVNDTAGNLNYTNITFTIDTIIPLIEFNNDTDNVSLIGRNYLIINVSAIDTNLANITINVYNSTGSLINTTTENNTELFFNLTGLFDGTYYFNATTYDLAGHINYTETRNITIDTLLPNLTFNTPSDSGNINRQHILINVTANKQNIINITIELYNSSNTLINSTTFNNSRAFINISNLTNDIYYYNATVYDTLNRIGYSLTENVTINTNFPTISFTDPTETELFINRDYILINTSTTGANITNVSIQLYNSTGSIINSTNNNQSEITYSFNNLSEGTYYFNATVLNLLNHTDTTETRNITIDLTNPTITLENNTDNETIINRSNIIINVSANDINLENITINIYNENNTHIYNITTTNNNLTINYTLVSDGIYYFNATTYDKAGNYNYTETRNITIDTTAPILTIESPTNITYNTTIILVHITSNGNNTWFYNGTENQTYTEPVNITFNEGTNTIHAWTNDTIGNLNYTNITFTIDTLIPIITFNNDTDNNSIIERSYIVINVSASDTNLANITINIYNSTNDLINSTTGNSTELFFNLTNLVDETYYFNATTYDKAGNYNYTETRNITIDFQNPTLSFVSPTENGSIITTNYILINLNAYDVFLNNITVYLYNINNTLLENSSTTNNSLLINFTNLTDGTYYVNATAYDNYGHSNQTTTLNITTDTIFPSISFNYPISSSLTTNITTISINITVNDTYLVNNTIYLYNSGGTLLNNLTSNNSTNNITLTLSNGTYYYNATAYDLAGNYNYTSTRTIIINTSIPEVIPPSSGGSSGGSGGGGGSSGVITNTNNTLATTNVTFTQYWPNIINGTRTVNIDRTGMPVIQIIITTNNNTYTANTLNIITQKNNPTNEKIDAPIYNYIITESSMDQRYVDNLSVKFKVDKNWLKQNNLTADNITLYTFNKDKNWSQLSASKYSEDTGYYYYSVQSEGLNNMAIGGPINPITALIKESVESSESNNMAIEPIVENNNITLNVTQKSLLDKIKNTLVGTSNKIYTTISELSPQSKSLIIVAISSTLTLLLGIVAGILVYRNAIKPKRRTRNYINKIISGSIMPYKEEPPLVAVTPTIPTSVVQGKTEEVSQNLPTEKDPEFYLRKINQLILQCEYSMDNGKIEEAKNYYAEARTLYFHSNMDYEHKAKVYNKIIELHGRLNK